MLLAVLRLRAGGGVIVIDRAAFSQGRHAHFKPHIERTSVMDTLVAAGAHTVCAEITGPIVARDFKGPNTTVVQDGKVVCQKLSS